MYCVGCSSKPQSGKMKVSFLTGGITKQKVDVLLREYRSDAPINVLVVNTRGGHEPSTLLLAKAVAAHSTRIIVDGACVSACAHLLLPAASEVSIQNGSLVALHTNVFGWLLEMHDIDENQYLIELELAREQHSFLKSVGMPTKTLFCAHKLHVQTTPLTLTARGYSYRTKFSFVVVDPRGLESLGVNLKGHPQSAHEYDHEKLERAGVSWRGARHESAMDLCRLLTPEQQAEWSELERLLKTDDMTSKHR